MYFTIIGSSDNILERLIKFSHSYNHQINVTVKAWKMAYICLPFTKLSKLDVITLYCPNLISIFNHGFASYMKLVL